MPYIGNDRVSTAANTPVVGLAAFSRLFIGEEADLASTHSGSPVVRAEGDGTTIEVRGTLWSEFAASLAEVPGADFNTVIVHAGGVIAIGLTGDGDDVQNAGEISAGGDAIVLFGSGGHIVNSGVISASAWAIHMTGAEQVVLNSGTLQGSRGIVIEGNAPTVVNHGTILGWEAGVDMISGAGTVGMLENHGTISGDAGGAIRVAVRMGLGADVLVNSGVLRGKVQLADNADLYDGRLGTVSGPVEGGAGNDTLLGGAGPERLDGGAGEDEIDGGGGDDTVLGGDGADLLEGGAGFDLLSYASAPTGVLVSLLTGEAVLGQADDDAFSGFEGILGGSGHDTLTGDAAANRLAGGAGNDRLAGEDGRDTLQGGAGNDTLQGGVGGDLLFGGQGADLFRLAATSETGLTGLALDRIRDFSQAEGDRIDLSAIDANSATVANDAFVFTGFGSLGGFSGPGQARFVQIGTATFLQLNTDADAAAEAVVQLGGLINLTAADLIL